MPQSMVIPGDLKALSAYIKRAEELDKDVSRPLESPVVAFYCRQYAMELGIDLREGAKDPEAVSQFLLALIEELETAKAKLGVSRDEGEQLVYKFAMEVFARADAEDRSGRATKATARTFYAASVFMDTLKQFGNRGDEVDEKCRYSKWKAADILKAIKEGRDPAPGGPNELEDTIHEVQTIIHDTETTNEPSAPPSEKNITEDTATSYAPPRSFSPPPSFPVNPPPPPSYTPARPPSPPPQDDSPPRRSFPSPQQPPKPTTTKLPPPRPATVSRGRRGGLSDLQFEDALEYAHFAVAALEIKDANLAIERLQGALDVLRQQQS